MVAKILGVLFLVAGVLVLVYHGFSIPREREAKIGPVEVSVKESERVEIPNWVGVACVVAGGGLLLWSGRKQ
jgi:drug/metabolite transporter (DMT)-like permease